MDQFMGKFGTVFARGTITRYTKYSRKQYHDACGHLLYRGFNNWQVNPYHQHRAPRSQSVSSRVSRSHGQPVGRSGAAIRC